MENKEILETVHSLDRKIDRVDTKLEVFTAKSEIEHKHLCSRMEELFSDLCREIRETKESMEKRFEARDTRILNVESRVENLEKHDIEVDNYRKGQSKIVALWITATGIVCTGLAIFVPWFLTKLF